MSARIRTGYSFRQAAGKLEEVMARCEQVGLGRHGLPITDTSTFGWTRWDRLCRDRGVRPIFGAEIAVTRDITAKRPVTDHWTFLARDTTQPVHDLIRVATAQFRYTPLLTIPQAVSV